MYQNCIAVNGDEIYVGGVCQNPDPSTWESSIPFYGASSGFWEGVIIEIQDGPTPTVNWGLWLGGDGIDGVFALAVDGDEIFVAGMAENDTNWEEFNFSGGGVCGGLREIFLVKVLDNDTTDIPSFGWGHWFGGSDQQYVYDVTLRGEDIFLSGGSISDTWDDGVTFSGTHDSFDLSDYEAFIVKLTDGATPTLRWGQWLGGDGTDIIYDLEVNGNEIYACGTCHNPLPWDDMTLDGSYAGSWEGFVVNLTDGVTSPTLNWGTWLGGTDAYEYAWALAVDGNEVYVGGSSDTASSWETMTVYGTHSGKHEAYVVKLIDNPTGYTLSWIQWLGGPNDEVIYALYADGDEIYCGGSYYLQGFPGAISWSEVPIFEGVYGGTGEAFVVKLTDDGVSPVVNYGQWLGGSQFEEIRSLTVSQGEIYVSGIWYLEPPEEVTMYGSCVNSMDLFVAKMPVPESGEGTMLLSPLF